MDDTRVTSRGGNGYPEALARIYDPPERIFIRGNAAALGGSLVAVVGTRLPTRYGADATRMLASALARAGACIVSGLALGIDAIAHEAALDAGGRTIAVLGAGTDAKSVAPRTNAGLAERIVGSGGALISEYAPGTQPQKHFFIARNRIIAGLSTATIIVEAATRSGALATADFAMESGREVFAVPGPITSPKSQGTNALIAAGAIPAISTALVLAHLGLDAPAATTSPISPFEHRIMDLLRESSRSVDELIVASGAPASDILAALAALELAGNAAGDGDRYRPV